FVAEHIRDIIMYEVLSVVDVQRRADVLNKKYDWPDEPNESVTDLIGSDKETLLGDLSNFEIDSHGEGDYIIDQSPDAGSKVESGSTIRVYLSDEIDR